MLLLLLRSLLLLRLLLGVDDDDNVDTVGIVMGEAREGTTRVLPPPPPCSVSGAGDVCFAGDDEKDGDGGVSTAASPTVVSA